MAEQNCFTIRQWRNIKGMSQAEFAKAVGMKPVTYSTKERGIRSWRADEIVRIAKYLGVSIENNIVL
jgi:transcriptional regulator with XRE-family HTH domain